MYLTTDRLFLRDFTEDDLSSIPAAKGQVDVPAQPFDLRDADSVRRQIRAALANARAEPRLVHDFAILLRPAASVSNETPRLIGRGGFRRSEQEPREAQFWFLSDPGSWSAGYVGEAAQALFGHCFGELGLHRLYGECDPRNSGAVRLLEKLGMRREAVFVENAWTGGKWADTAVYGLLDREWKARGPVPVSFKSSPSGLQ